MGATSGGIGKLILDVLVLVRIEYIVYSRKVSILNNNKKVTDYTRYLILDFRILNFMIRKMIQDMKKNLCS